MLLCGCLFARLSISLDDGTALRAQAEVGTVVNLKCCPQQDLIPISFQISPYAESPMKKLSRFNLFKLSEIAKRPRPNCLRGLEPLEGRQLMASDISPTGFGIIPPAMPQANQARVPGEIVVGFRPGTNAQDIRGIAQAQGLSNLHSLYMGADPRPVQSARVPEHAMTRVMDALRKNPKVQYVEPNYSASAFFTPNDPYLGFQWHMQSSSTGSVNASAAWDVTNGSGTIVAVLDTGVAYENRSDGTGTYYVAPDLTGTSFVAGYDFINNDPYANDDHSHGTHVAGTIAQSTNNSRGTAGVAYGAALMPVKVLGRDGSGSHTSIAQGIRWAADQGAHVINLSLGSSSGSTTLEDALAYASSKGVTIIAAAGNNGQNAVSYPAAYDAYVIAVSATRFDEALAPYSNYGSSIDLAAPGGDTSVDQNGDGYVDGVLQNTFSPSTQNTGDFGYYFFQGTSMAAPHVAGVAALVSAQLIKAKGFADPTSVRNILQSTARDRGATGADPYYGYGIVDAAAAVQATLTTSNSAPSAVADSAVTIAGQAVKIAVLSNDSDPDGDALKVTGVSALTYGTAVVNSDSTITYTPPAGFTGTATFSYTIADPAGLTSTAQVSVAVDPAPIVKVADLDGTVSTKKRHWQAQVTAVIRNGNGELVSGATVTVSWSNGSTASGITNASGVVTFTSGWLSTKTSSITLTITQVSANGYLYDSTANSDPDGDSTGTKITVNSNGTTTLAKQSVAYSPASMSGFKKNSKNDVWDLAIGSLNS